MEYKIVNGTAYKKETPMDLIGILEGIRDRNIRVTFDFGDTETRKSWGETLDISGYVGRSTGERKIPLLIHNSRSMGGGALMDNRILSIRHANKKNGGYLYKL